MYIAMAEHYGWDRIAVVASETGIYQGAAAAIKDSMVLSSSMTQRQRFSLLSTPPVPPAPLYPIPFFLRACESSLLSPLLIIEQVEAGIEVPFFRIFPDG